MLMPVETWGYSYVSLNIRQFYPSLLGGNYDCASWLYVVAGHNDTRVRIVPAVDTRGGHQATKPYEINLQQGEIYLLQGAIKDKEAGLDVSGTTITAVANDAGECYPVAVFSGSSQTQIACTGTNGTGDNIMQQLFPYGAWGSHYLTAPTSVDDVPGQHNMNIFRILVKDPSTVVRKNGQQLLGLNGSYYEYQSNTADFIEADQPVLVAQYMPSENACGYMGNGDPEMIYLSASEQAVRHTTFYRHKGGNIRVNYLTLIIPTGGLSSFTIDGVAGNYDDVYMHPRYPGYSVVVKRWKAAQAQCVVESDSGFTAITYGMGATESYGYNAGTFLNSLNGFPSVNNRYNSSTQVSEYTCVKAPAVLSVFMRYQPAKLVWQLSALAGAIFPAQDIVQNNPLAVDTEIINGLRYYKYSLPGYYVFNKPGYYNIPLYATSAAVATCSQTEQVQYQVQVKPGYSTQFSVSHDNCKASALVSVSGEQFFANNESIRKWEWFFSDQTTASGKSVTHVFNAGSHTVRLIAADEKGCIADTMERFSINDKPVADFIVEPAVVCQGAAHSFTDKSSSGNDLVAQWTWDFGDGSGAVQQQASKRYTYPGKYNVTLTVVTEQGCVSDPAQKEIIVYPQPIIDAGASVSVMQGTRVTLDATAADASHLKFHWTPAALLDRPDVLRPVYLAIQDQTFTLHATGGEGSCTATDEVTIRMLRPVNVPNVFSPNGDGVNDRWLIANLSAYTAATVKVFNRSGQEVYASVGYPTPWDGTRGNKPLAAGTYYYVIQLGNGSDPLSGAITILR
jgi:gliding motility-associated-like protein